MEITTLALFVLAFGSILILPGPNSGFAVGQSLKYGVASSIYVPLGFMTATGVHAILVLSGIGIVVQEYSVVLIVLKWSGIIYLLWLGYKAFISKPSKFEVTSKEIPKRKMYFSAVFVSLTNPKALIASLMVYPLFVTQEYTYLTQAIILSLTAMAISFVVYGSYSLAASSLKDHMSGSKLANKIVGSMYVGAAGALATK